PRPGGARRRHLQQRDGGERVRGQRPHARERAARREHGEEDVRGEARAPVASPQQHGHERRHDGGGPPVPRDRDARIDEERDDDGRGPRRAHRMYSPPLTCSVCPVMCRDSSLARNTATLAMSSGWAMRPSGMILAIAASSSSVLPPRGWAVSVVPGAIAFTRMPCGASSRAIVRVIVMTPPLLAV